MIENTACLICDKHNGFSHLPPGGMIFIGEHFSVCHAPPETGPLGTLFIEANRHIIDYAEMTDKELSAYGKLLSIIYKELRKVTGAERIYQVTLVDGVPHFHTWLVPRLPSDEKGIKFLKKDVSCEYSKAEKLADKLRKTIAEYKI